MNFSSIRQSIEAIDYSWTNPQTCMVLIPGLSLLIQKVQMAKAIPMLHNAMQSGHGKVPAVNKFLNICIWHLKGSAVQAAICSVAYQIFKNKLLLLFSLAALLELADTVVRAYQQRYIFAVLSMT